MVNLFSGNAMWQLVKQSDAMSKFVMLVLFGMSIVCWAVFLYKIILLSLKTKRIKEATIAVGSAHKLEDVVAAAGVFSGTLPGYFLSKTLVFLKGILQAAKAQDVSELNSEQVDLVQQHMYNVIDDVVHHEESYMSVLSTCAAASPLLGLFGTVWGLVHAFIGITEKQSADIAAVAPGIAEALMTTLAGLMVAIPALIMFNVVNSRVRSLEYYLNKCADTLSFTLNKLFVG